MKTSRMLLWGFGLLAGALLVACSSSESPKNTSAPSPAAASATQASVVGCSAVTAEPTASGSATLTTITAADYSRGPAAASVTLLYYCDFQSAECELFNRVLDRLVALHPDDLRVVMRPFPIPASVVAALDKSESAAEAALAAGVQAKFWEMRDTLHQHYADWTSLSAADFDSWLKLQAADLKLNVSKFEADRQSPATRDDAHALYEAGGGRRHHRPPDCVHQRAAARPRRPQL